MKIGGIIFITWIGAAAVNFAYQYLNNKDWLDAVERVYFQGIALLTAYALIKLLHKEQ